MAVSDEAFEELQRRVGTLEDDMRLAKRATADMDRDLSDFRATNRAVLQSLNALRQTQIEHGRRLDRMDQRFDGIDQRLEGQDGLLRQILRLLGGDPSGQGSR